MFALGIQTVVSSGACRKADLYGARAPNVHQREEKAYLVGRKEAVLKPSDMHGPCGGGIW